MEDFDTIPVPGADTPPGDTDGTDSTGADDPFTAEPKERTRELAKMEAQLRQLYANVGTYGGMVTGPTGYLAGGIVAANAEDLAASWIDLAERDAGVRRAIQNVLQGGGWAGVIGAHVVTVLPILAVAGVLPQHFAHQVFRGLAAANPSLYLWLAQQTGNTPTAAAAENGTGGSVD